MQANNWKDMRTDKLLQLTIRSILHGRNVPNATFLLSSFLGLALLLAFSSGCAPANQNPSDSASNDLPELTEEIIRERINDAWIRKVPEENGTAEPISWSFDEEEPKELVVVEKQMQGDSATVIIDIKTGSAPRSRSPKYLAGQIRTKWKLNTGWALRKWEIMETENISMKYRNLPKPPEQNSNR